MNILIVPVILLPVITGVILAHFKKLYNAATDEAEKHSLKKMLTIAIVLNVLSCVALAILIAALAYFILFLKFAV